MLNSEQQKAVNAIEGPVLLIAGPGTGKTEVLARRIENILKITDTNPESILCLTFTENGGNEMRKRLFELIGNDSFKINIKTFHSFCNDLIQTYPEKFTFKKELIQLNEVTQISIINEIIDSYRDGDEVNHLINFNNPYMYTKKILESIKTLKKEGFNSQKFKNRIYEIHREILNNPKNNKRGTPTNEWRNLLKTAEKNLELSIIYSDYEAILIERGFYDFEDMILRVIERFQIDEEFVAEMQERFLYILVDEYQDTNGSQNEILKYFGTYDSSPNIFAVGDDDQGIFRFQGANLENLLFFDKQFQNVQHFLITTNYRSTQYILNLADSLISNCSTRLTTIKPELIKQLKQGGNFKKMYKAGLGEFEKGEEEIKFIVKKINELKSEGDNYSDIAIIYHDNKDGIDIAEALLKEKIPFNISLGINALQNKVVEKIIKILNFIEFSDVNNDEILGQIIFYDFFNFNQLDLLKILHHYNSINKFYSQKSTPLFFIIADEELLQKIGVKDIEKFKWFTSSILNWKRTSENETLKSFFELLYEESGLKKYVLTSKKDFDDLNAIKSFYTHLKESCRINPEQSLKSFLNEIKIMKENNIALETRNITSTGDRVTLQTAHKSKGSQYKNVFITKVVKDVWGDKIERDQLRLLTKEVDKVSNSIEALDEQRRLLYVAITRAKERLFITYSKIYGSGDELKVRFPSRFISELNQEYIEKINIEEFQREDKNEQENIIKHLPKTIYSIEEEDYLKELIKNFKLSASSLNSYIKCPLKFKYENLIKTPKSYKINIILGNAIHSTLEQFLSNYDDSGQYNLEFLLTIFRIGLEKTQILKADYIELLKKGEIMLTNYFNYYNPTFKKPLFTEYNINNESIFLEDGNGLKVRLRGKIDKIELINEDENSVRIVDYKASKPRSDNYIKGLTKADNGEYYRQLLFYKLLSDLDKNFKIKPHNDKMRVEELQIDFIDADQNKFKKATFKVNEDDVKNLKNLIYKVYSNIQSLEFEGSEEFPVCKECTWCKIKS